MPNQYWDREYKYLWNTLYLKCKECWEWKLINDYHKSKWYMFWVKPRCKECRKKYSREYRSSHKDMIKESNREYKLRNKCEIKEYLTRYRVRFKMKNWFNIKAFHNRARDYANTHSLMPSCCSICWGWWEIELHHPSYKSFDEWSKVVFCCRRCHKNIHAWNIKCPDPINLLELV